MKILVTYFSQSGNTEKIAKAIWEEASQTNEAACKEKGIEYVGCFDYQGALAEAMHAPFQKKLGLSDEQWAGMVKQMTGHPNEEDVANAKACARDVLG